MLLYQLQKWWHKNGWFYIMFASLFLLFFIWIFFTNKDQASSSVNMNNVLKMVLNPETNTVQPNDFHQIPVQQLNAIPELDDLAPKRSKGEQICYNVLKELTGREFSKIRPDWLINPITKEPMEIDLYNDDLKLGVEYNGEQHYEYNKFMHQGSKDKFRAQQYRDYLKNEICKKRGVYLITVPYKIKHGNIKKYLSQELKQYLEKF